ncbi:hypothetical protein GPECTOR_95g676 [Gonium pectorale]|uniref:Uncharacterized protein n=1 Tax=Gonium pectorale TaxID=33097 RepID=A0A150G0C8_GONPE|nr:hypothetical protein GPECTOR_95g676 [Gonium pectorale]|eukprot:KXZ43287.1 hypothetical protein GPECTOR_95g676 [Gonium pectorale]
MRHQAIAAVLGALWLLHRRNAARARAQSRGPIPPIPPIPIHATISATARGFGDSPAQSTVASVRSAPGSSQSASPKSVLGAVLQWIFLILLGAAVALSAVKGAWEVFGLLLAAASMQLAGQMTRWAGGGSGRRSGARGPRGSGAGSLGRAAEAAPPRPPVVHTPDPRLAGVWVKDASRSDSMDEALSAMRLNGLVRTAVRLIRGTEVDGAALAAGRFDMAVFSVISWFKHAASVAVGPDGSVLLSISWGEPLAGSGTDHFALIPAAAVAAAAAPDAGSAVDPVAAAPSEGDILVVTSTLRLTSAGGAAAAPITYRTVYTRAGRGRHHNHSHPQAQEHHPPAAAAAPAIDQRPHSQ